MVVVVVFAETVEAVLCDVVSFVDSSNVSSHRRPNFPSSIIDHEKVLIGDWMSVRYYGAVLASRSAALSLQRRLQLCRLLSWGCHPQVSRRRGQRRPDPPLPWQVGLR